MKSLELDLNFININLGNYFIFLVCMEKIMKAIDETKDFDISKVEVVSDIKEALFYG